MLGIDAAEVSSHRAPWNKGRLIGQKRPLKPKEVWAIRVRLQLEERRRDLALFNLALDSKLRGCDLVRLQVNDVCVGGRVRDRATVIQRKTGRPVQFEITEQTRAAIRDWVANSVPGNGQYLFPSRFHDQPHISTRQYARIVHRWVERAGLDSSAYGTHSMRRTKAAQIYKKTGNLRAVQLLLGHTSSKAPSVTLVSRSTTRSASPSKWNSKPNPVGGPASRGAAAAPSRRFRCIGEAARLDRNLFDKAWGRCGSTRCSDRNRSR
jgi:integrase